MHRSPPPFETYAAQMPAPPSTLNGWGRWVAGAIAQIDARMSVHDRHSELTNEHIMDLRERVRSLEDRADDPPRKEAAPPPQSMSEWVKGWKEFGTALVTGLMWLTTVIVAICHALGLPVADKLKGILHALGAAP